MTYRAEGSRIIGDVSFGSNCSVWYNAVIRGDDNPVIIGNNVNIQDNCVLHAGMKDMLFIADNVTVGHSAILHGCSIGENTIVGMGSIIMDGSVIGRNTIVAAGSLVSEHKTFPDGVLLMGRPAKVVRELTEEEIAYNRLSAQHYVKNAGKYLQAE